MTTDQIIQKWNQFWFEPQSPVPMAVVRILFGLIFFQYALLLLPDLHHIFGTNSMVSVEMAKTYSGSQRIGLLEFSPQNDLSLDILFGIFIIATISLTVGFVTKPSAVLVYLGLLTLDVRNPYVFGAPDMVLKTLSFLLIFSHCDKALSIDRLLKRESGPPAPVSPWAQRLIQVFICFVYWSAFSRKIIGQDWINGTAVYYVAHFLEEQRFAPSWIFDNLVICKILTWSTMLIELAMFTLIWIDEFRIPVIIMGMIFHLIMDITLILPLFQLTMIAALVCFIPPAVTICAVESCSTAIKNVFKTWNPK